MPTTSEPKKPLSHRQKRLARRSFKRRTAAERDEAERLRAERRRMIDGETVARLLKLHRPNGPRHAIEGTIEYWHANRAGWDMTLAAFARDHGGRPTDPGMSEAWLWWMGIGWECRMELLRGEKPDVEQTPDMQTLNDRYCELDKQLVRWRATAEKY